VTTDQLLTDTPKNRKKKPVQEVFREMAREPGLPKMRGFSRQNGGLVDLNGIG
jgi:hypothetical protein